MQHAPKVERGSSRGHVSALHEKTSVCSGPGDITPLARVSALPITVSNHSQEKNKIKATTESPSISCTTSPYTAQSSAHQDQVKGFTCDSFQAVKTKNNETDQHSTSSLKNSMVSAREESESEQQTMNPIRKSLEGAVTKMTPQLTTVNGNTLSSFPLEKSVHHEKRDEDRPKEPTHVDKYITTNTASPHQHSSGSHQPSAKSGSQHISDEVQVESPCPSEPAERETASPNSFTGFTNDMIATSPSAKKLNLTDNKEERKRRQREKQHAFKMKMKNNHVDFISSEHSSSVVPEPEEDSIDMVGEGML